MTLEELKKQFGDNKIYKFSGSENDFHQLLLTNNISYSYVMSGGIFFYITSGELTINDDRITEVTV